MLRFLQRATYAARFPMALVLPIWLLGGAAIRGGSVVGFVGVVLLVPLVVGVQVALSLLFSARGEVRRTHRLGVRDAALLVVFQVGVVGFGCFGPATVWFGVVAAAAALAGLWFGTRRLADDVRSEARRVLGVTGQPVRRAPLDIGEVVVLKTTRG